MGRVTAGAGVGVEMADGRDAFELMSSAMKGRIQMVNERVLPTERKVAVWQAADLLMGCCVEIWKEQLEGLGKRDR